MTIASTASTATTQNAWIVGQLVQLQNRRFYGKLIVEMKEGKTVLLRLEETLKPPDIRSR